MARMPTPAGERFRSNLRQLSISQTSIETLSKYAQFHGDDAGALVDVWWEEFSRADPGQRLAFVYLLSDIAHAFKGRPNPFLVHFEPRLEPMVDHILQRADPNVHARVGRTLKVWHQRQIFNPALVGQLLNRFDEKDPEPVPSPDKTLLIEAIRQHDNEAFEDVLLSASAAPYLANPSLQGLQAMRAHEARLDARRARIQKLVGLLNDRLDAEKAALAACLSDLAVCRSKIDQCSQANKRPRLDPMNGSSL